MDITLAQILNELVRDTQVINEQAERIRQLEAENAALKSQSQAKRPRKKPAQEPA